MKDSSKTRKLLAELRKLYKRVCVVCGGGEYTFEFCETCRKTFIDNEKRREELKAQLAVLPHIPNKKESKELRQKAAKKGSRCTSK